jgi:type I restriction enzyme S subunit
MAVTAGYKQTDAGALPIDWDAIQLGSLVKITSGASPSLFHFSGSGVPYFKVEQLGNSEKFLSTADTPYMFERGPTVPAKSVVFAKRGAAIALNKIRILSEESFMDTNLMALTPQVGLDSEYLFYALGFIGLWRFADTTSVPQINNKHVKPLAFPLPTVDEQRAIAAALSDVDALLDGLDRLIAKKRALKLATMDQLISGKVRLPGFAGEWAPLNLARCSHLKARIGWQGLTTAEYRSTGSFHLVTGTDFSAGRIDWATCPFVAADRYEQDRNIQLRTNDVLVTKDGTIGKVAFVDNLPGPATLNSGVFVIRPKDSAYHPRFLYFILASTVFEDFLRKLAAGSTISHLYQKDFVSFEFLAPTSIEEQATIASVLSDMDSELAAIETRRDKFRNLKKAMMQELLTGRTRLVNGGVRV